MLDRSMGSEAAVDTSGHFPGGALVGGRYRIVRTVGRGGMGVVYEATNELTHGRVAIKTLSAAALSMEGAVQRFAREAKAAGSLRSVHVGRVLDASILDDGSPFLVMEFYDGWDLYEEIRTQGGVVSVDDACSYVIQACAGLAEAHQRGFVHRDLKPANLFLAQEGGARRLKVLDFGISKHLASEDELTKTLAAIGTPLYMSPEQVRDAKHIDQRSDVWALGVILYRILTGVLPFRGNATAVIAAILMEEPTRPRKLRPEIPGAVELAMLRALRKAREERFRSVNELAAALAPFTTSEIARHALNEMASIDQPTPARRSFSPTEMDEGEFTQSDQMPSADALTDLDSLTSATAARIDAEASQDAVDARASRDAVDARASRDAVDARASRDETDGPSHVRVGSGGPGAGQAGASTPRRGRGMVVALTIVTAVSAVVVASQIGRPRAPSAAPPGSASATAAPSPGSPVVSATAPGGPSTGPSAAAPPVPAPPADSSGSPTSLPSPNLVPSPGTTAPPRPPTPPRPPAAPSSSASVIPPVVDPPIL